MQDAFRAARGGDRLVESAPAFVEFRVQRSQRSDRGIHRANGLANRDEGRQFLPGDAGGGQHLLEIGDAGTDVGEL